MNKNRLGLRILELLEKYKNKKIMFWGASKFLKEFIRKQDLSCYNIEGIIDKDDNKWGTLWEGYTVYSPKSIIDKSNVCIISSIANNAEKAQQGIKSFLEFINNKDIFLAENVFYKEDMLKAFTSNHLYIIDKSGSSYEVSYIPGLEVVWSGADNVIKIYSDTLPKIKNTRIYCDNNDSEVSIGYGCDIMNFCIYIKGDKSTLNIGDCFTVQGGKIILGGESGTKVTIGNDCMFAGEVYIKSSDSHTVYDNSTQEAINIPDAVHIGNHVWLGYGVSVLKNSMIPDNSVVAARSVVSKKFDEHNVVLAGVPAKVVKKNINWHRVNTEDYVK